MDKDLKHSVDEPGSGTSAEQIVAKDKSLVKNKWFWVGLVAVVLVLAGLTYFIVSMLSTKQVATDDALAKSTRFASPRVLVDTVKPEMRGTVVPISEYSAQGGKTADGFGAYGISPYKTGDRKYSNLPGSSFGTSYNGDSSASARNYQSLVKFFEKNKFRLISSGKDASGPVMWLADDVKYISYATYESSNIVCLIWHVDATTIVNSHVASVGCADKDSYAKAAEKLDPFFAAYTKGEADPAKDIVLGDPQSGDSNTKGYRVAVVYQEDPSQLDGQFEGLYLKGPGEKDWTYFMGSRGWLDCDEFGTDDLKKAFSGFNCQDKATNKIINVGDTFQAPTLKNE